MNASSWLRRMAFLFVLSGVMAAPLATAAAVELSFWEHEFDEVQKALDGILTAFQKANPDIKVKRSHYKTEDLRTQYQTAAMGGGGGDILLATNDFAGPFSTMAIIQSVQSWIDPTRFTRTVLASVTDPRGTIWGVPVSRGNHLMLFVNNKMVKKAPTTVEELISIAAQHSDAKTNKFGFAYNLNEPFWFVAFLGAYGQQPLVEGKPKLAGDGMVKALTLVKNLKFKDRIVPPDCDYNCAETLFIEGKVAMIINGDWAVQKYKDTFKEHLQIAPLPTLAATGKPMAPMVSGKFLFFNKKLKGEKLAAAKKLSDFMTSKPVQEQLTKSSQRLPVLQELAGSAVISADPVLKATDAAMAGGQPMPMDVEMRVVWDAMRPQLQAVMAGRTEPSAAALVMQKDADTKLKEMHE